VHVICRKHTQEYITLFDKYNYNELLPRKVSFRVFCGFYYFHIVLAYLATSGSVLNVGQRGVVHS